MDTQFQQVDFGPLKQFLDNDDVTDISYSNGGQVWLKTLSKGVYRVENTGIDNTLIEKIAFQCRVNFESIVSLCRFALDNRAEHLDIINVSSVSGIYPMPYFAIYSATKGALTSFSQSLRAEMKGKNVAVTAILPGAMPTREDIKEQIKGQGLWGKLAAKTPEAVAKASLKAVRKNKGKVIVGFWNKVMRVSTCWLPTAWRLKFIANRWSKISKDAF